jgi:ribosomal protein S18 acetylase RimI-like enzyme
VYERLEIRRAQESDRQFARHAHHAGYRDVVERQFGPWDEASQDGLFEKDWDPATNEIITADGEACGYFTVEYRADDIHLRELLVHPSYQRRGIGTWLLRMLQEKACVASVPIRLGTFHRNEALQLYRRLGFQEIGTSATHVLMEWMPPA